MKAIQATLAAALFAAAGLASAAPAFEGGQASQGLTLEPVAAAQGPATDSHATTAAALEGGQASQGLTFEPGAVAQRSRADVRAEGRIAVRAARQAFEGGQAS